MSELIRQLRAAEADYTIAWGSGDLYEFAADEIESLTSRLAALERETIERCAQMAERHFICGHSVAGPAFAKYGADAIRALALRDTEKQQGKP